MRFKTVPVSEAARIIGISRQAVHLAIKRGELKAEVKEMGGYRLFFVKVSEANKFKKQRKPK